MLQESNLPSKSKDVVLLFLQGLFSQENLYSGKNDFRWINDHDKSQIYIGDVNPENLAVVEMKPSILVTRGQIQWIGNTLDSRLSGSSKRYSNMVSVDMTMNCFSSEGLEAELLASLVFQLFTVFKQDFRREYGIHRVDVVGLGAESIVQAESGIELVAVPVFIRLVWNEAWEFSEDLLQLNKLKIDAVVDPTHSNECNEITVQIPIEDILVNPARIVISGAETNPNLKPALRFTIVGSDSGHDGLYTTGPIQGDVVTLLSPLKGENDELGTSASFEIVQVSDCSTEERSEFRQEITEFDQTPPRKRPDIINKEGT